MAGFDDGIGFNFRDTVAYVTDGAGQIAIANPVNQNLWLYPQSVTVNSLTFDAGWVTSSDGERNYSTGVDVRLAGTNFVAAGQRRVFRIDLDRPGRFRVRLASGIATTTRGANYWRYIDQSTVLGTYDTAALASGQFEDATGTLRATAAAWVSDNAYVDLDIKGEAFVLQGGNGTVGANFSHLYLERIAELSDPVVVSEPFSGYSNGIYHTQQITKFVTKAATDDLSIASGVLVPRVDSSIHHGAYWNGATFTGPKFAEMTLAAAGNDGVKGVSLFLRGSDSLAVAANLNAIGVRYSYDGSGNPRLQLVSITANSPTTLAETTAISTPAANDVLRIEEFADNLIKVFVNGVERLSHTTSTYASNTRIGWGFYSNPTLWTASSVSFGDVAASGIAGVSHAIRLTQGTAFSSALRLF